MPDKPTKQIHKVKVDELETIRAEDFRFIHANRARLSENFFDATLVFSSILPPTEGVELPYIEEQIGITMSWEHLKALVDVLAERLENYESQLGAIRARPGEITPSPKAESKPRAKSRKVKASPQT